MANTANLDLPLLSASQAQKHVTHNEAIRSLDALVQLSIKDRDLTAPPGSPAEGDRYIPAATATGDWAGQEGNIAAYLDGGWQFFTPQEGWQAWVDDENLTLAYNGSAWAASGSSGVSGNNGSVLELKLVEEELTGLSGASATTSAAFPNQCIILGVASRTTTTITGATSYDVGDGSTVDRFGGSLNIAAGSTNQGNIGPAGNYASTTVTLTANGGNFTGGAVRVALAYIELTPPTS